MRILGLDPGSRICGYGVIEETAGELRYVECGVLTAPEHRPMEHRLGEIARGLEELIGELEPGVVAIEDVFIQHNARSGLALAQARGMALAVVGLRGLDVSSYPPASVKKAVSGSGRADKDQVARMVQALIGLKSLPRADATDALAVAITHAQTMRPMAARIGSAVVQAGAMKPGAARLASSVIKAGPMRPAAAGSAPTAVRARPRAGETR